MTLAVWSVVLLGTYFTGRVAAFLHPSFRPGVLVAGFALAAIALLIASKPVPPECCADATCTHPLSRSQGGRWLSFLILVLPVSVAAWLSPEHFSKQAFEQRGVLTDAAGLGERQSNRKEAVAASPSVVETSAHPNPNPAVAVAAQPASTPPLDAPSVPSNSTASSAEKTAQTPPPSVPAQSASTTPLPPPATALTTSSNTSNAPAIPDPAAGAPSSSAMAAAPANAAIPEYLQKTTEGYVIVEVLDMLYAVQDSQLRKDFEGRTVQLIAQMMPQKASAGGPENRFKAVRMFMTCCAADARPVATMVQASPLPDLPEMTWVRIVGKATFPVENGKRTAVIEATSVQQTKPPEEAMLF